MEALPEDEIQITICTMAAAPRFQGKVMSSLDVASLLSKIGAQVDDKLLFSGHESPAPLHATVGAFVGESREILATLISVQPPERYRVRCVFVNALANADLVEKSAIRALSLLTGNEELEGFQYLDVDADDDHAYSAKCNVCSCELRVGDEVFDASHWDSKRWYHKHDYWDGSHSDLCKTHYDALPETEKGGYQILFDATYLAHWRRGAYHPYSRAAVRTLHKDVLHEVIVEGDPHDSAMLILEACEKKLGDRCGIHATAGNWADGSADIRNRDVFEGFTMEELKYNTCLMDRPLILQSSFGFASAPKRGRRKAAHQNQEGVSVPFRFFVEHRVSHQQLFDLSVEFGHQNPTRCETRAKLRGERIPNDAVAFWGDDSVWWSRGKVKQLPPGTLEGTWQYDRGAYTISQKGPSLIFEQEFAEGRTEGALIQEAEWLVAELTHGCIRLRSVPNGIESQFKEECDAEYGSLSLAKQYEEPVRPLWKPHRTRWGVGRLQLSDGRVLWSGGEYEDEDQLDPEFCIFNDVLVEYPDGRKELYTYPRDVLPPTDFHACVQVNEHAYLIGNVGYCCDRTEGPPQVVRVSLSNYAAERLETSAPAGPGWSKRGDADARVDGRDIVVLLRAIGRSSDGERKYWRLNIDTLEWRPA